jgi:hypothetical protein
MNDSNPHFRRGAVLVCLFLFCGANYAAAGAPPVVSNVRAAQRTGTQLVDIYYDVADADSATLTVTVAVDSAANVSVAEQYNHTIRKVTSAGEVATLTKDRP